MKNKKILSLLFAPLLLCLLGLTQGSSVANFHAKNQDGKIIELEKLRGKYVLLYFYPKDDTPGCTKEACAFRDNYTKIQSLNTVIYGISRQDAKSHKDFIEKHQLPFDLLVDEDGEVGKAVGVATMPVVGFHKRQSVLLDPQGKVVQFYDEVDPIKHAREVIHDLEAAQSKEPKKKGA